MCFHCLHLRRIPERCRILCTRAEFLRSGRIAQFAGIVFWRGLARFGKIFSEFFLP
jgi:hypothetical protein